MKDFTNILNKKIDVVFNGNTVNSKKIIELFATDKTMEGRGKIFESLVEWEKQMPGATPRMDYDEQTLIELSEKGISVCPGMSNLCFVVNNEEGGASG